MVVLDLLYHLAKQMVKLIQLEYDKPLDLASASSATATTSSKAATTATASTAKAATAKAATAAAGAASEAARRGTAGGRSVG